MKPKKPLQDWEIKQKEDAKRERLARAVGRVLSAPSGAVWLFRHDNEAYRQLENLANHLPGLDLIDALEELDAEATAKVAAFDRPAKRATPREATPAKKKPARAIAKPRRATPAKKAAKPAKKSWPTTPKADLDAKLPGYLEDQALDIANEAGAVTAGDLLKALPEASRNQVSGALGRLVTRGRLVQTGKGRHTKYSLANGAGAKKAQLELDQASPS